MTLDSTQRGVATGMALAVIVSAIVLGAGYVFRPFGVPHLEGFAERIRYVMRADLVVFIWLVAAVANVARQRFFSPADIDGSGLAGASPKIRVGLAVLQNTLEQVVLAVGAHFALAATARGAVMVLILPLVVLFCVGRVAFWAGYGRGAAHRAFGFASTFYPTVFAYLLAFILLIY
jgi:hypothetical protein